MKWKVIVYAENHGNSSGACLISVMPTVAAEETITVLFPCKETTKRFRGLEKGRCPQVDEAVLQFVSKALAKQL